MKIKLFLFLGLVFLSPWKAWSGEFLVIDKEVTWGVDATMAFYPFHPSASMPGNWLSPDDYYHGTFYTRYEIISEATSTPCGMQFDIFQWKDANHTIESELCESVRWLNNGAGSVVTNSSSPSTWWQANGGVDFSKISDLQSLSATIWCNDPESPIGKPGEGGDSEGIAWSKRFNWFPITFRITVVAVSTGSTFKGWDYYLDGGNTEQQPTPTYGIDYYNAKTNKSIPSTDEYSYYSDMSGAVSGSGQELALTPGKDVYFRTKAGSGLLESDIQHLIVDNVPSSPSITIDYYAERTSSISSSMEWSTNSSMSSATSGTDAAVPLMPGTDLYIRVKSTSSSFASAIQNLIVPERPENPSVSIDFINEKTLENIGTGIEYSTSSSYTNPVNGNGSKIILTPGQDLYLWVKFTTSSFYSHVTHLPVPNRPTPPSITIDYISEKTSPISSSLEWSTNSSMTPATSGTDAAVPLTPGTDLYIRVKSSGSFFASEVQNLDVSERPWLQYNGDDIISVATFTLVAILDAGLSGFDLSDVSVTNGHAQNLQSGTTFDVIPNSTGDVSVMIPVNALGGASFASNIVNVYFNGLGTGLTEFTTNELKVYPVPSDNGLINVNTSLAGKYRIEMLTPGGEIIRRIDVNEGGTKTLDLHDCKGTYYLKVTDVGKQGIRKIILY
jgi:hypothetical protein